MMRREFNVLREAWKRMAAKVIKGKRLKITVKKEAAKKKARLVRRAKKSKATSVAVLVLSGSTALRRRKSAETLAESLQTDLFRVDLSAVVSQYIGETEKNLNDVFDKAETSGAILFFDEVDALFRARGTVTGAHDRFASAETAHFLQRIESHSGIVILTTNGKQRVEQAFSPQTKVVVMVGTTGTGRMRNK
jgi:SpoVK/Ycf46/Vps4 family AAA+-type ATPase